jgi:cellulose synthase/poly-beta-1,6-N-acetylglucosamine synthase-like glycosyltransferase
LNLKWGAEAMTMTEIVFWVSVFMIVYPYIIYPALIAVFGLLRPRPVRGSSWTPLVTVLIPAYNEASCIAATVANKLDQEYPAGHLQIIVVSDGSTDGTDEIVRGFASGGVELIRRNPREGKAAALNEAVRHAKGDIIVFSDANSLFAKEAIRRIVENFADREVGYVTGKLQFRTLGPNVSGSGISAYMKYENALRTLETRCGSIIGVNGGVDAIRRDLYTDIPRQLITDFVLPLHVISTGHRVIYDERVCSVEVANKELGSEFRMRVRVALRGLQGLAYMRRLLNPMRYPGPAFSLISHKVLRYLAFLFLPVALVTNIMLSGVPIYAGLLGAQVLIYGLSLIGLWHNLPRFAHRLTAVPTYFLLTNVAFTLAALKFLRGEKMATWQPRAG